MNTPINEDFDKYKDDFWKGLSMRETLWGAAAITVGFSLMLFFLLYLKWNTYISVLLIMPFVAFIGFNGFFTKNGMTLGTYVKRKIHILFGKPLVIKGQDVRKYKVKEIELFLLSEKQQKKRGDKNGTHKI